MKAGFLPVSTVPGPQRLFNKRLMTGQRVSRTKTVFVRLRHVLLTFEWQSYGKAYSYVCVRRFSLSYHPRNPISYDCMNSNTHCLQALVFSHQNGGKPHQESISQPLSVSKVEILLIASVILLINNLCFRHFLAQKTQKSLT